MDVSKELHVCIIQNGFFGAAHRIGEGAYNDETWHSYTLPKEDRKSI